MALGAVSELKLTEVLGPAADQCLTLLWAFLNSKKLIKKAIKKAAPRIESNINAIMLKLRPAQSFLIF
jgi:hypothetical protein